MRLRLEMRIAAGDWSDMTGLGAWCAEVLETAAAVAGCRGEVSVMLTDDAAMQALNARWRDRDMPTDVLSFPAAGPEPDFLGDIAIADGVMRRAAAERGRSPREHLAHLLVHGLLHLAGHDHLEDTQAVEMEALERRALAKLGIPDPYSQET